jgi:hypothetical protein
MEGSAVPFGSEVRNGDSRGRKEGRKMMGVSRIEGVWKEKRGRLIWLRGVCKAKTTIWYVTFSN